MIKRKHLIIFIAIMILIFPVYASENEPGLTYKSFSNFTIKAFKNNPGGSNPTTILSVYDALTGTLNEVGEGSGKVQQIDVEPYLKNFISNGTPSAKLDKQHVLFSYFVTGSEVGHYSLKIEIPAFVGPLNESGKNCLLHAFYKIEFEDTLFPSKHDKQSGTHTISQPTVNPSIYTSTAVSPDKKVIMNVSWDVTPTTTPLNDSWLSEGVILMYMEETDYTDKFLLPGAYKSDVKVTLTYGG